MAHLTLEEWFRRVFDLGARTIIPVVHSNAAFPNGNEANYGDGRGEVFGTIFIQGITREIPVKELNTRPPHTIAQRFRDIFDWSRSKHTGFPSPFTGGLPNFHDTNHVGIGDVYGATLVYGQFMDAPSRELFPNRAGPPDEWDVLYWMRAVHDYAVHNGFVGGFPSFHTANYGDARGLVCGVVLFKNAVWRDVPGKEYGINI